MKLQRTFILSALVLSIAVGTVAYADEYATTTAISISTDNEEVMPEEEFIEDIPETDSEYAVSSPEENEVQLGSEDIIDPNDGTIATDKLDIRTPVGEQGRGDCLNLENYYFENGYPDYLSFVFVYDKFLDENEEIALLVSAGLTDMSQENIDAVLDIADDRCYITFSEWEYSYTERKAVYDEIRAMESEDLHVWLAYDDRVSVNVLDESNLEKYREMFSEKYGDIVTVDCIIAEDSIVWDGGAVITPGLGTITTIPELGTTGAIAEPTDQNNTRTILIIAISAALVLLITGGVYLLHKSKMRISSDGTVAASVKLTNAEIERAVADSIEKPSSELKDRIMREIK